MNMAEDELMDLASKLPGYRLKAKCPIMNNRVCLEMANPMWTASLHNVITHLNDFHACTREDIADWLDGLDIDDQLAIGVNHEQTTSANTAWQPSVWSEPYDF